MSDIQFHQIMEAERKIYFYGGEKCDEQQPYWETGCEGDKGGDNVYEPLKLDASTFPPGTTIFISVPCCPKCQHQRHDNSTKCSNEHCGYNWSDFDLNYS